MNDARSAAARWCLLLTIIIVIFANSIICCEDGSYCSKFLGDCTECPSTPLLDCSGVHEEDRRSCLKSCARGPPKSDHFVRPTNVTLNHGLKAETTEKQNDARKCEACGNQLNDLGIFAVFLGGLIVGMMIICFILKIQRPLGGIAKHSCSIMHHHTLPLTREETLPTNQNHQAETTL